MEQTQSYQLLKRWDVIPIYGQSKAQKKAVLVADPRVDGDRVTLALQPVNHNSRFVDKTKTKAARFSATAQAEVLGQFRLWKKEDYYESLVMSVMVPGVAPMTIADIVFAVTQQGQKAARQPLYSAGRRLANAGHLICRMHGRSPSYRLPLPQIDNLPVVFRRGALSEMLGWIEEWKEHKQAKKIFPIVRLINGQRQFGSDATLDPVSDQRSLDAIASIRLGNLPQPPTPMPDQVFFAIAESRKRYDDRIGTVTNEALRPACIALGLAEETDSAIALGPHRMQVIGYLDEWYPGWRYGFNIHNVRFA